MLICRVLLDLELIDGRYLGVDDNYICEAP